MNNRLKSLLSLSVNNLGPLSSIGEAAHGSLPTLGGKLNGLTLGVVLGSDTVEAGDTGEDGVYVTAGPTVGPNGVF
jgi:hypothetical protein